MNRPRRAFLSLLAGGALAACLAQDGRAQAFPNRPVRLIVPFPAGGANDTIARVVAQGLSTQLGQPVIVENQAGAGGTLAMRQVAGAAPDGHTLLMVVATNTFGTAPHLYRIGFDPRNALGPVAMLAADKQVLVASPAVPAATIQELVAYAKSNPDRLNYGSATGITVHFLMELFKRKSGAPIVHIPYRGGAPMITDLLGGQVQITINGKSVLMPHIAAGKLRALAVSNAERWPELPGVPTLLESGYMDFPYETVFGLVAPAGTPQDVVAKLNGTINDVLRSADAQASFKKIGIEPRTGTPQDFARLIADEAPRWAEIVKITGIKLD